MKPLVSRRAVLTLGAAAGVVATVGADPAEAGGFPGPTGLVGRALRPGDRGYADEVRTYNLARTPEPGLIVAAETPGDVRAAVRLAAAHRAPVAVLATGHQQSVPIGPDAVMVTTRAMRGVTVDARKRVARVEAGALWQNVVDKCVPAGLAPVVGSTPIVGVVGYTLGGGLSPVLGRKYGYAADHVRSIDLVGADGRLRTVTADSDPELFFGLRGGKSNFGLVTAIEFDLFPVPSFYGGSIFFDGADAARVLHAYRRWLPTVPDETSSSVALLGMPDHHTVPRPLRGKRVVSLRVCHLGRAAAGAALVRPMRAVATPLIDGIAEQPFAAFPGIHADPVEPAAAYERTALLRELSADAVDTIVSLAGPITLLEVRHLGGALARQPGRPSAVSHRDAAFTLFMAGFAAPGGASAVRRAEAEVIRRLAPWSTGGTYLNFMSDDDAAPDAVRRAYSPEVYQRLRRLKRRVDPANTFRLNHNIPPA